MKQFELITLIRNQCARYGEPSTYRAIADALSGNENVAEAIKILRDVADTRAEIYRKRGL